MNRSATHDLPTLGVGIYALTDAARLTRIHPSTARTWFRSRSDQLGRGPIFAGEFAPEDGDFAISFLDLIDLLIAGEFRRQGVSMKEVRLAYRRLQSQMSLRHPFGHRNLYTDGRRIICDAANAVGGSTLHEVVTGQQLFDYIRGLLEKIDYNEQSKLAQRWMIAEGVMVDPRIGFGKPTIKETATSTAVIERQYRANREDAALVADLYSLSENQVLAAVEFERSHNTPRKAA